MCSVVVLAVCRMCYLFLQIANANGMSPDCKMTGVIFDLLMQDPFVCDDINIKNPDTVTIVDAQYDRAFKGVFKVSKWIVRSY